MPPPDRGDGPGVISGGRSAEESDRVLARRAQRQTRRDVEDGARRLTYSLTDIRWAFAFDGLEAELTELLARRRAMLAPAGRASRRHQQRRLEQQDLETMMKRILGEQDAARLAATEPEARARLGWPASGYPVDQDQEG